MGRASRAEAQDTLAARHDASGDVTLGVHAKIGGIGAKNEAALDPLPRGAGSECQLAGQGGVTSV